MNDTFTLKDIIRGFNRAADTYATASMLPNETGSRLIERLDLMKLQPAVIVDLGCANGHLSKALSRYYKQATIIGIDLAHNMLTHAKKQTRWRSRERFINADANQLPLPDHSVDLIFSNLMFAWCNDINVLLPELRRVLHPEGLLLFATLGPDTLQELKASWREVDKFQHAHHFLDMHDIGDCLVKAQFLDPVMDMEKLTLHYKQTKTLINDLKALGMHNIATGRKQGCTTPRQFLRFQQAYEKHRTADGHLPNTFEVIYGHAWTHKMVNNAAKVTKEVIIPVSHIKRKHT